MSKQSEPTEAREETPNFCITRNFLRIFSLIHKTSFCFSQVEIEFLLHIQRFVRRVTKRLFLLRAPLATNAAARAPAICESTRADCILPVC